MNGWWYHFTQEYDGRPPMFVVVVLNMHPIGWSPISKNGCWYSFKSDYHSMTTLPTYNPMYSDAQTYQPPNHYCMFFLHPPLLHMAKTHKVPH